MHKVHGRKTEEEIADYEWLNRLQNKIIIFFSFTIIGLLTIVGINMEIIIKSVEYKQEPEFLSVVTKELGDTVILAPQTFVSNPADIEADNIKVTADIANSPDYKYSGDGIIESANKQYLDVGKYDVKLKYKGETYSSRLVVQDTTPPEFLSKPDLITMKVGEKLEANKIFDIKDLSTFDIEYSDISKVKFDKEGTYPAEATARDEYGNKTTLKFKIKIIKASKNTVTVPSYSMSGQIKSFDSMAEAQEYGYACMKNGKVRGFEYYTNNDGTVTVRLK